MQEVEEIIVPKRKDPGYAVAAITIGLMVLITAAFFLTHDPQETRKMNPQIMAISKLYGDTLILNKENATGHAREENDVEKLNSGTPVRVLRGEDKKIHTWDLWCRYGNCYDSTDFEQAIVLKGYE